MPELSPRLPERSQITEFYFKAVLPGEALDITSTKHKLVFDAHIIGLTDSSSPSWNADYDMGRADPVMLYGSFARSLTISYLVVALTKDEYKENWKNLRILGTFTYPIYEPRYGYNAPHIFYKVGGHMGGIGVIQSLDYNWPQDYPWIGTPNDPPRPLITEVTIGIKVLTDEKGNRPIFDDGKYSYFGVPDPR